MEDVMDDGYRPHQYPKSISPDDEVVSWRCDACGEWIAEMFSTASETECPIDWRRKPWPKHRQFS